MVIVIVREITVGNYLILITNFIFLNLSKFKEWEGGDFPPFSIGCPAEAGALLPENEVKFGFVPKKIGATFFPQHMLILLLITFDASSCFYYLTCRLILRLRSPPGLVSLGFNVIVTASRKHVTDTRAISNCNSSNENMFLKDKKGSSIANLQVFSGPSKKSLCWSLTS